MSEEKLGFYFLVKWSIIKRNFMLAIETKNLTKEFNGLKAVDNISLEVKEGEIFGLLGPNGAGKTTTIKILATLLNPTKGEAKLWGFDILKQRDEVRNSIGIVFQEPALDNRLTGKENLDFHARLYGLDKKTRKKRIEEVLNLVELQDKANVLVINYSGGMQRRLEIARGLMHYPKILFLDEVLKTCPWVKKISQHNGIIDLNVDQGEKKIPLLMKIDQKEAGFEIKSVNLRKPTLEDVFLHFTGKTIREAEVSRIEKNKRLRPAHHPPIR